MSVAQTPIHAQDKGSDEVDVVAIISPKPGKEDRVEELLRAMTQKVHEREPNTTRYHLSRSFGSDATPEFVMVETYKAQADFDAHLASPAFAELGKAFKDEGLLAKGLTVLKVKSVAGFEMRK